MTDRLWSRIRRDLWERPRGNTAPLDGLRGFAIAIVVLYHCSIFIGLGMEYAIRTERLGVARQFLTNLWTGVDIFFVLSGFLIGSRLFRDVIRDGKVYYPAFLIRRVCRIFPAYYLVLALSLFVIAPIAPADFGTLYGTLDWNQLASGSWTNFLFLSNYLLPIESGNILSWGWSVCVEEHFYLLLPPFLWVLFRFGSTRLHAPALAMGIVLPLVGRVIQSGLATPAEGSYFYSHLRFDELFVGVWIGYCYEAHPNSLKAFAERAGSLLWIVGWTCIGLVWGYGSLQEHSAFHVAYQFSLVSIGTGLLLVNCLYLENWVTRLFSRPAWYPLARISYALYLIHPFAVFLFLGVLSKLIPIQFMGVGSLLGLYALVMLPSFLLASMMFLLLERPLLDVGARLSSRWRVRAAHAEGRG